MTSQIMKQYIIYYKTLEWERVRFVSSAKRWIVEFEASGKMLKEMLKMLKEIET